MTIASVGKVAPFSNRKPARIGDRTAPPRPTPITKPVPVARTCVADRQMLGLVLPLITAEMKLDDVSLGLLTGFVFTLFYSLLGIPI